MARLRHRDTEPPGGWKFYESRTRLVITETSLSLLIERVIEHRIQKSLGPTDPASVQLEIERQICTRLNETNCFKEGVNDEWVPIADMDGASMDIGAIMGFSKMMLEWVGSGREVVPVEELTRRAEICRGCPLNQRIQGCGTCSILYRAVNSVIAKERKFEDLHVCNACSCSINAKIQLPRKMIEVAHQGRDLKFPTFCWNHPANEV